MSAYRKAKRLAVELPTSGQSEALALAHVPDQSACGDADLDSQERSLTAIRERSVPFCVC